MAVSRSTAQDLGRRGMQEEAIAVIPNGVDLERYAPAVTGDRFETPTLLYLGRLKRYKRVDLPIRAVAALRAEGVPVRLIVAGTGDHAPMRCTPSATSWVWADAVDFRGFVDEAEKLSSSAAPGFTYSPRPRRGGGSPTSRPRRAGRRRWRATHRG
jgi:glycosyltransferase involved in cell wall biosynthesis